MQIRSARHSDLPGILEIYNEAVQNTTATYDYEPRTLEDPPGLVRAACETDYAVFVAENEQGRIVGWSALNLFRDSRWLSVHNGEFDLYSGGSTWLWHRQVADASAD